MQELFASLATQKQATRLGTSMVHVMVRNYKEGVARMLTSLDRADDVFGLRDGGSSQNSSESSRNNELTNET
jgi:hypothetical protein